jgi:hypothetical protein
MSQPTLTTPTTLQMLSARWQTAKPIVIALAVGLVTGPFISNAMGWQVTAGSSRAQARAGIVEQQASYCNMQARTENKDPGQLDWNARGALAKKWAMMPGTSAAEADVVSACSDKLART